ncbi:hypothetical protein D3C87_1648650 [compost metagenome]
MRKTGGERIGETRADTNDSIRLFYGFSDLLCAGRAAVGAVKTGLALIKDPFAHQHRRMSHR